MRDASQQPGTTRDGKRRSSEKANGQAGANARDMEGGRRDEAEAGSYPLVSKGEGESREVAKR
jgi:hypothetical protein